jgi:Domain of unknown function (DUF4190)/Domain of unknown function (DUF1707)
VQALLNDAFADGRLTREEWDDRATALAGPVTYGELARLTADLPAPFVALPPVPAGPWSQAAQRTNGMAIAAIACGFGQLLVGFPAGIAAIILGHKARRQIRQTGEQGDGLALTGLILGYAGTVGLAIFVALALLFFMVATSHQG